MKEVRKEFVEEVEKVSEWIVEEEKEEEEGEEEDALIFSRHATGRSRGGGALCVAVVAVAGGKGAAGVARVSF